MEGRRGEELTTSILRFLILRSPELRDRIIDAISRKSVDGSVICSSHFSCHTEYATKDNELGPGRLDLVIEVDDAVIGIENKLHAAFQPGQPEKYRSTVRNLATELEKIRRRSIRPILVVLYPQSRDKEISDHLPPEKERKELVLVTWEELLERLSGDYVELDSLTRGVLQHFRDYVHEQIGFIPKFSEWAPHLRAKFESRGTVRQREVVSALWRFFPDPGPRLSFGETWVGYYFSGQGGQEKGWYGFVPEEELKGDGNRRAELIVVSSCPIEGFDVSIKHVTLSDENWIGRPGQSHAWIIDFDESWNSSGKWVEKLAPLSRTMQGDISA